MAQFGSTWTLLDVGSGYSLAYMDEPSMQKAEYESVGKPTPTPCYNK